MIMKLPCHISHRADSGLLQGMSFKNLQHILQRFSQLQSLPTRRYMHKLSQSWCTSKGGAELELFTPIYIVSLNATNPCDSSSRGKAAHSPGIVPPQAQRAAFFPPLEQNVQQWNMPWCLRNLLFTITMNGEPCRGQASREAAAVHATQRCVCISKKKLGDPVSHRSLRHVLTAKW